MRKWVLLSAALLMFSCGSQSGCTRIKRQLVTWFSKDWEQEDKSAALQPEFSELDAKRPRIGIRLRPVVDNVSEVTDIQFPATGGMIVLEKTGTAHFYEANQRSQLFRKDVITESEEGLLGLAFHPRFAKNGKFYVNANIRKDGKDYTEISEWSSEPESLEKGAKQERVLLLVHQPYQNHNAGQLAFGPDGLLYVGFGDGGWRDDPHGNGQNPATMLGSMLRIDVDNKDAGKEYAVPQDNPFVGKKGFLPETWAYGLRNPWRYSFDKQGRLWLADVGQDTYEEIDIIERGGNYGWNIREARHCFEPKEGCKTEGLIDPVYEYGRDDGISVTGGYVYEGTEIEALRGKYVFGDFGSGRIWAIPADVTAGTERTAEALGKWPFLISTFGMDTEGELYVGAFSPGAVYKIEPLK